jgi:peptidase E
MLYNQNGETFKLVTQNKKTKLYHKAENRWSSGWTYVGEYINIEKAKSAARLYAS